MKFEHPLETGTLLKRYKRFLADVEREDGSILTIHCPNTGSMKNCQEPGSRVWFTDSGNSKRKYPHTWQVLAAGDDLVGINTGLANKLAVEAVQTGTVPELSGYRRLRTEVPYGGNSRIDLLLSDAEKSGDERRCFVEVKNVTLGVGEGLGLFPDAVTSRGQKHLRELMAVVEAGDRAVMFFCVQHTGIDRVAPADAIDREYGDLLRQASAAGVELLAYGAEFKLSSAEISLRHRLPVELTPSS